MCLALACVCLLLVAPQVEVHQQQRLLFRAFTCWREELLVRQQYNIIVQMVSSRRSKRLLWQAWTAWRVSGGRH